MKRLLLLALGGLALSITGAAYAEPAPKAVAYPEGYRNWTHVKSMLIEKGHPLFEAFGGLHHIYANKQAMKGYQSGSFPNGSVIVFDLLDVSRGADNGVTEGARKVVGVMRKDTKAYAKTGGWGYEGFKADSKTERVVGPTKMLDACHGCHAQQAKSDFVFSKYRK